MRKQKGQKSNKIKKILILIINLLAVVATAYLIYSLLLLTGIENKIRLLMIIDLVIILVAIILFFIKAIKKKSKAIIVLIVVTIAYIMASLCAGYYINKTYKIIDRMTTSTTTYSTSLVTRSDNKVDGINDIDKNSKIGMIDDETDLIGYQLPTQAINENNLKNEIVGYGNYIDLINDLYDKKIDYIFLPSNYVSTFKAMDEVDLDDIDEKTKIIFSKEKTNKTEEVSKNSNLNEPFSVLVMGVDSTEEDLANTAFNGDALLLITFNPTTLNTTMLSIPRDSYVPITCTSGNRKNKINSAALYGEKCMVDTVSNFTGIDIDYYVKINFKGVVNVIDALGGVEVDVPYSFCEQDSNRKFGKHTIYVKKGLQKLNGEQALALSRNRKANSSKCSEEWTQGVRNEFVRGQNQQLVLRAILNKLKEVKSIDKIYDVLDKISKSMVTNMQNSDILSLYNVGKDIIVKSHNEKVEDLLGIQKLYLNGYDGRMYDTNTGLRLYYYILYQNSIDAVSNAMKVNLGLKKPTIIKKFSFNIDKAYEQEVIGKNVTGGTTNVVSLPSFIGMSESTAKTKAANLGITVSFNYVKTGTGVNGTVIKQNYNSGTDVNYVKNLTLTVLKEETVTQNQTPNTQTSTSVNETTTNTTSTSTSTSTSESTSTQTSTDKSDDVLSDAGLVPSAP